MSSCRRSTTCASTCWAPRPRANQFISSSRPGTAGTCRCGWASTRSPFAADMGSIPADRVVCGRSGVTDSQPEPERQYSCAADEARRTAGRVAAGVSAHCRRAGRREIRGYSGVPDFGGPAQSQGPVGKGSSSTRRDWKPSCPPALREAIAPAPRHSAGRHRTKRAGDHFSLRYPVSRTPRHCFR